MATQMDSGIGGDVTLFHTSQLDRLINMARENSLWYLLFGLACCGIELIQTGGPRADLMRFGAALPRFSPRQADLLMVTGTVNCRQAPILKRVYESIAEPKWVVAFGVCASTGGFYDNYATLQGIDRIIPVDVYIPGCPPRPEALTEGLIRLQELVRNERWADKRRAPAAAGAV